ncbi:MAG: hypothetical protein IT371_20810 [Deltaproteobacteria bacterium]|nr:hypothetical protein [Deltaproteobacteria bacterium]
MRRAAGWTIGLLLALGGAAGSARADGLEGFVRAERPPAAVKRYGGTRRPILQVTNQSLQAFTRATAEGVLEAVIPKQKGHIYFRLGGTVHDFYPGGYRCGPVRPIGSERYGVLIPLTGEQQGNLARYFEDVRSGRVELGAYDFEGLAGHHCVSWLLQARLDARGRNLLELLGGQPTDGDGMVEFSRFLVERAQPVSSLVLYSDRVRTPRELGRERLQIITLRELVAAFEAEQGGLGVGR